MKTRIILSGSLLAALVIMMQFFYSCRHEISIEPCQTDPLILTVEKTDAVVNKSNGTIKATATGGSGIQYSLNSGVFRDSGYFSGLQPFNDYHVVAKNSWGCTDTAIVTILSFDPCAEAVIKITATKTDASPNLSNGSISAAATGGSGFTYSINGTTFQSSGTFSNLAAGNYIITAKSFAGCTGTIPVTIGTVDPCASLTVVVTTTQVNPILGQANGSITATATGGSGFTFSLNNGPFQSSGTFNNLAAGNYTVTAKNSNGCTGVKQIALTATDPCAGVTVTVTTTQVNPTTGQSNGSITATATSGSGFTYSLNNGAFQTTGAFNNLAAGTYTITAKNSNGCIGIKQVVLGSTDPCAGVTVTVSATQVNPSLGQSNGSITASASGGTGFTYSLNNGTFQTSGTFNNLAAGTYTITAKNSSGCIGTKQVTLIAVDPCAGVTVTVSTTQVNPTTGQSNGSITATAAGGTGFTYSLNNGVYQTSGTFNNLVAGTYTITAKNSNGCIGSTQVTLTAIDPCNNINITISTAIVNYTPCQTPASGQITVTASGSSGFTYNLNGRAYQTSNVFSNLNAGNYTIGVKDANGCTKTTTATVATAAPGPLFAEVRTLITSRCSNGPNACHMNGGSAAGYNFDNDCSIITWWSQINQTCVTYTMKKMPLSPQPLLTTTEKQKITNWVNAGHRFTD